MKDVKKYSFSQRNRGLKHTKLGCSVSKECVESFKEKVDKYRYEDDHMSVKARPCKTTTR